MTGYTHILLAVDFSEVSDMVGRRAVELASRYGARMTLLHVVDYLPPLSFADDFTPSPALMIDEHELLEQGKASLENFAVKLACPDATQTVLIGAPRQEIVRLAAERDVDLIVLGSHGRHGWARLLGSTARAVVNDAPCDVLAVRVANR